MVAESAILLFLAAHARFDSELSVLLGASQGVITIVRGALPLALFGSVFSVLGAMVGLSLAASVVQIALGVLVCAIALMMLRSSVAAEQGGLHADAIARVLGIRGRYVDPADGSAVRDYIHVVDLADAHIRALRAKIDRDYAPPLITTVRGAGYMLEEPDAAA